uniref:Polynucleotide adenylyltransferase family protein n=1 Tax=Rhizophora mucronata TaxID=61149 RepID=A0A2P2LQY3_RHIMU
MLTMGLYVPIILAARILRAVRIAARLGFRFSKETAHSVKNFSKLILRLDKTRLLMEMNYMLAYGSAEASLRILWKFGLLEILLPLQAAYFVRQGFRRRDKRSNMLLSLFSNLDRLLAPDRPCHSSLWVGLLAFHKALSDQPRDPVVVAAFLLTLHNGGDLSEAVNITRIINRPHDVSFHELLEPQHLVSQSLADEVKDLAASVNQMLSKMTDEYYVSKAMLKYPQAPYSDLVSSFFSFVFCLPNQRKSFEQSLYRGIMHLGAVARSSKFIVANCS